VNSDGTFVTTTPDWRVGWVAGAGAQMRLWNSNWLGRVEYLHYDFGSFGSTVGGLTNGAIFDLTADTMSHHMTVDTVRAGVDYQFH
jgi:outer membrane immunogenic protein